MQGFWGGSRSGERELLGLSLIRLGLGLSNLGVGDFAKEVINGWLERERGLFLADFLEGIFFSGFGFELSLE